MIAKTLAELEDVLAEELIGLGADNVEIGTRMVSFTGDNALMYKANLHCRTALRILKPIYEFKAETADEVYEAIKKVNWEDYLTLDSTFSIDAVVFSHIFTHSKFVAYKVKDAIADWFTEKYEKRPSVSLSNPDLMFNIHVSHNKCTLSLDSSGESLHKRGYRIAQTEAPLSEVLAAGMILKSGWKGESTLIDPMCGSGTILIEAAMIALGIPPGIHRPGFAFEKWNDFDKDLFSEIYNDDTGSKELFYPIIGTDISSKAISIAEKNIKNAGLKKYIELNVKPFQGYTEAPSETGVMITNPPYGERIKVDELDELYSMIGERLKHVFTGYRAYILSYRKESFDAIGLKHSNRFFLYNGPLECEMREYEIFSGKRNELPKEELERAKTGRKDSYHNERNSKEGYRRSRRSENDESEQGSSGFKRQNREDRPGRDSKFTRDSRSGRFERSATGDKSDRGERPRSFNKSGSDERPRRDLKSRSDERPYSKSERSFDARSKDRPRKPFGEKSEGFSSKEKPRRTGNKLGGDSYKSDRSFKKRGASDQNDDKRGPFSSKSDRPFKPKKRD
ncbi:MAG: THUMP domain-containing protein [Fermentimonas sp.]|nr:THUMP domain-containing protein [Fermentimonas sp.]